MDGILKKAYRLMISRLSQRKDVYYFPKALKKLSILLLSVEMNCIFLYLLHRVRLLSNVLPQFFHRLFIIIIQASVKISLYTPSVMR